MSGIVMRVKIRLSPARQFLPSIFQVKTSIEGLLRERYRREIEPFLEVLDDALRLQEKWYVVDRRDVVYTDDLVGCYMTEHRNLVLRGLLQRLPDDETASNLCSVVRTLQMRMRYHSRGREVDPVHEGHEQSFG